MKNRFNLTSKEWDYVEFDSKIEAECFRAANIPFKGKHIKHAIQAWDDVVMAGRVYPQEVKSRYEFITFNRAFN